VADVGKFASDEYQNHDETLVFCFAS
jgi:hypothetical protein